VLAKINEQLSKLISGILDCTCAEPPYFCFRSKIRYQ